jgi:hypothetical protein
MAGAWNADKSESAPTIPGTNDSGGRGLSNPHSRLGRTTSNTLMANYTGTLLDDVSMRADTRKQEYLAKAKEAEDQAQKSKDEPTKASWLRIAAGYHDLAARQDKGL